MTLLKQKSLTGVHNKSEANFKGKKAGNNSLAPHELKIMYVTKKKTPDLIVLKQTQLKLFNRNRRDSPAKDNNNSR